MISTRWRLAAALTAVGLVALFLAALLQDNSYWSSVLIEVGAAIMLLAPLLLIEQRFEQRQQQLLERVEDIAQQVQQTRIRLDQLDEATQVRIEQATRDDEALFRSFEESQRFGTASYLMQRALELNAITPDGVRVAIPGHELRPLATLRLRFRLANDDLISVSVEDRNGRTVLHRSGAIKDNRALWDKAKTVDALMSDVVVRLQAIGVYSPGAFRPEAVMRDFLETLQLGIESRTAVVPLKIHEPLIERLRGGWVITDGALRHLTSNVVVRSRALEIDDLGDRNRRDGIAQEIAQRDDIGNVDHFWVAWHTAIEFFTSEELYEKAG